jgi:sugar transferase EpsL
MREETKNSGKVKRIFDILFALSAFIFLLPIFLFIIIALFLIEGMPIFFTQTRPGKHGVPFQVIKFRTMKESRTNNRLLLPDEERITRFGNFLRRSSLDELPELINVIKGEMSIVGPRPLLMQYLERYSKEQSRRNEVLPGITGWAQVHGRNAISWEEKFILDVWYVDHWSFWLDIRIIFTTIGKVIKREGVSQQGQATMEEFMGTPKKDY